MLAVAAEPESEPEAELEAEPEAESETEPEAEPEAGLIAPNVISLIASPEAFWFSLQLQHLGFGGTHIQEALRLPCSDSKTNLFVLAGLKMPTRF